MTLCSLLLFAFLTYNEAAEPAWGAWGVWSGPCTLCPGAISRGRTRVCIPGDDFSSCSGPRIELEFCQNCIGEWTEWVDGIECSDTCGNCGRVTRTRHCRNAVGCPPPMCTGNNSDPSNAPCDSGDVCTFPRATCCEGKKNPGGSKRDGLRFTNYHGGGGGTPGRIFVNAMRPVVRRTT